MAGGRRNFDRPAAGRSRAGQGDPLSLVRDHYWNWRRENQSPSDDLELVEFIVTEANTLAVRIYEVHPIIDGNTRATWHLRNYALMLDGLRPLIDLSDLDRYENAWWSAAATDHTELDEIVLAELAAQQPNE